MTILSPETLANVIELIEAGATVAETTTAVGGAPRSKIIFAWLKSSEAAAEFDARPDASSPWCITRGERLEFFHVLYREAVANGRATRSMRSPPIRRELEARVAAKRAGRVATVEPSMAEQQAPPKMIIEHVTVAPVIEPPPAPRPRPRPAYAYKSPRIEGTHGESGPPSEGRFTMAADRPKSKNERRAGTVEIVDGGIKQW